MHLRPFLFSVAVLLFMASCTSIQLAVPSQFSTQATQMPVKGLNGLNGGRPIRFGNYLTSKIKRGWNITTSQKRWNGFSAEEFLLTAFDISNENISSNQRTKYQYSIQDGILRADVFCHERLQKDVLEVKTGIGWLGDFGRTNRSLYSFSALIIPVAPQEEDPWKLTFLNHYDRRTDTARKVFDLPYVEETGYVTNGKDTIEIKPVRVSNYTTKGGKDAKIPFKILTGYELRLDDGVIAIVDTYGQHVWMYNALDAPTRLVVASVSSALLLRKVKEEAR